MKLMPMPTPARARLSCWRWAALALLGTALVACGGGGGSGGSSPTSGGVAQPSGDGGLTSGGTAQPPGGNGSIAPSSQYANMCTLSEEKQFTRSFLHENYLWYREIPASDASRFTTVAAYFRSLLVTSPDHTGQPRDRFSTVVSRAAADSAETGTLRSYGVQWAQDALGRVRAAQITPNSPAAQAGMARGGQLESVTQSTGTSWYPNSNATITFEYRDSPSQAPRTIHLQSAELTDAPVPLHTALTSAGGRRVSYLLFNAHFQGAQDALIEAIDSQKAGGPVQDLVLDMRYNRGGFVYVAQTLSSMVSGPDRDGQIFERIQYNDKRSSSNFDYLFTPQVLYGESTFPVNHPLPRLNLPRVYILSSSSTCSASESVINGLRGIDVEVVLVGQGSCGKPYGFQRRNNCDLAYFPIQFQGVNAKGFGDYAGGFASTCSVADDFDHPLGHPQEAQLAAALHHVDQGSCPASAPKAEALSNNKSAAAPPAGWQPPWTPGRLLHPAAP